MDDTKLIELLKSLNNLPNDVESHLFIDFTGHYVPFEIASRAVLQDEVYVVLRVDHFVQLDDVRMF